MKKIITLTHDQAVRLNCYLLMTTNYRMKEREAWEKLASETEEDGTPTYPYAAGNVQFCKTLERDIEEISKIIDAAPLLND